MWVWASGYQIGIKQMSGAIVALILLLFSCLATAGTVTISSNTSWTAAAPGAGSTDDVVVTGSGVTLTLGAGSYTFNSITVQSSAVVLVQGIVTLNVTTMSIDSTSNLNGNGQGSASDTGTGKGNSGIYGGGGGGYGGTGGNGYSGTGGASYGTSTQPFALGSGGGTGGSGAGGSGGGAVKLIVSGTLTVNGIISQNGNNGSGATYSSGGGSGGSIWISASTITGAGNIRAIGGNGNSASYSGGGGGGRIAVYYGTDTFSGNKTAAVITAGGTGYGSGSVGTVVWGPLAAGLLVFTAQPTTETVGRIFSVSPVVKAMDATNTFMDTSYSTNITLTPFKNSTCTTAATGINVVNGTVAPVSGIATFSNAYVNVPSVIYLKAASGTLTSACTPVKLQVIYKGFFRGF